jgi:hypothetical protein
MTFLTHKSSWEDYEQKQKIEMNILVFLLLFAFFDKENVIPN